jgi:hypothetical protein
MVKLIGPLCSLEARGAYADTLIYARVGMTSYAKAYKAPSNPNSPAQQQQRLGIGTIAQLWSILTTNQQAAWQDLADQQNLSPYHAYLRYNAQLWTPGIQPVCQPPTEQFNNLEYLDFQWDYIGQTWYLDLAIGAISRDPWGIQLCVCTEEDFTPNKTNTVLLPAPFTWEEDHWELHAQWEAPDASYYYPLVRMRDTLGGLTVWLPFVP